MPDANTSAPPLLTGSERNRPRPKSITGVEGGGKFAPDGQVLPFPGNTILCHIDPASAAHAALVRLQGRAAAARWAGAFRFLPPSSLHMTLFEGVCMNPPFRSDWPEDIPHELERDAVSALMLERIAGLRLPASRRIRPHGIRHNAGIGVLVAGATEIDEQSLRQSRERLRDSLRLRPEGFARYQFHITLGYLLRWLGDDEAAEVARDVGAFFAEFQAECPEIHLGPPEFCNFETMFAFTPLRLLDRAPG